MNPPGTTAADRRLLRRVILRILPAPLILMLVVFFPAGTLDFWQGWAYFCWSLAATLLVVVFLYRRDPRLLERRMLRKEKVGQQKVILWLLKLQFACVLALCALDHRLGWTHTWLEPVPIWLTVLALLLMAGCQILFCWVMDANRFAASIIQVESGQTIANTGPYRYVRHPMYAVGIVQSFFTPLALGSYVVWPLFVLIIPILVWRLLNEEKTLRRDLPGYAEYCQRTRYRLIPRVW